MNLNRLRNLGQKSVMPHRDVLDHGQVEEVDVAEGGALVAGRRLEHQHLGRGVEGQHLALDHLSEFNWE